jgi:serine/threonine-protein kinase
MRCLTLALIGSITLVAACRATEPEPGPVTLQPVATVAGRTLVWVDRDGFEEPIDAGVRGFAHPRLSPDDEILLVEVEDDGRDLWMFEFRPQTLSRLTLDSAADVSPTWAPDGWVVFASTRNSGVLNVFRKRLIGTWPVERLTMSLSSQLPAWVSSRGQELLIQERDADGAWELRLVLLDGEEVIQPLMASTFKGREPEVSPNGRWLAYVGDESGQPEVYVRPTPNVDDGQWQISTNGGTAPLWSPSGRELFYRAGKSLMVVTVEETARLTVSEPRVLFGPVYWTGEGRSYDISRDGQRFVMIKE